MQTSATRLLNEKQQAKELNISYRHIIALRQRRLIPFIRLGRAIRYDPSQVARAIQKLTVREIA
jgi:hypothetical protein